MALQVVGRGAFGEVIRARDRKLGREVAVKRLRHLEGRADHLARFEREARILAEHPHPGLVGILDWSLEARPPYAVLEWMPGGDLAGLLAREGALPAGRVAEIGRNLAEALAHLHAQEVLHRDIKLENVLLREDGTPALADLGLARPTEEPSLTRTGCLVGTPRYLPEEVILRGAYSPRSDLFALGVVLVELASGARPKGLDPSAEQVGRLAERLAAPRLRDLLVACVARRPEDRPASAGALVEALEGAEDAWRRHQDTVRLPREPPSSAVHPAGMERRRLGPGLAVGGILLAGVAGLLAWRARPVPSAPPLEAVRSGLARDALLRERLRALQGAEAAAQARDAEMADCVPEWIAGGLATPRSAIEAIESAARVLQPGCRERWEASQDSLGTWVRLADEVLVEDGRLRDPAGALSSGLPSRPRDYVRAVRKLEDFLLELPLRFPEPMLRSPAQAEVARGRQLELEEHHHQLARYAEEHLRTHDGTLLALGPVALVRGAVLAGSLLPAEATLRWAQELGRRLDGGLPREIRGRAVHALAGLTERATRHSLTTAKALSCAEAEQRLRLLDGGARERGVSEWTRRAIRETVVTVGAELVTGCPARGEPLSTWWALRELEQLGYVVARRRREPLDQMRRRRKEAAGVGRSLPRVAASVGLLEALAKEVPAEGPPPRGTRPADWPSRRDREEVTRRVGELEETLRGYAEILETCLVPGRELPEGGADPKAYQDLLDRAFSMECRLAAADLQGPLREWLGLVRDLEPAGRRPEGTGQFVEEVLVGRILRHVDQLPWVLRQMNDGRMRDLDLGLVARMAPVMERAEQLRREEEERWVPAFDGVSAQELSSVDALLRSELAARDVLRGPSLEERFEPLLYHLVTVEDPRLLALLASSLGSRVDMDASREVMPAFLGCPRLGAALLAARAVWVRDRPEAIGPESAALHHLLEAALSTMRMCEEIEDLQGLVELLFRDLREEGRRWSYEGHLETLRTLRQEEDRLPGGGSRFRALHEAVLRLRPREWGPLRGG